MNNLKEKNHILRLRVTEKATVLTERNVYSFEVAKESTKKSIMQDIKELYKVSPVRVAIVNSPAKKISSRGKIGHKPSVKKAYVYLKKGDTIDIA